MKGKTEKIIASLKLANIRYLKQAINICQKALMKDIDEKLGIIHRSSKTINKVLERMEKTKSVLENYHSEMRETIEKDRLAISFQQKWVDIAKDIKGIEEAGKISVLCMQRSLSALNRLISLEESEETKKYFPPTGYLNDYRKYLVELKELLEDSQTILKT